MGNKIVVYNKSSLDWTIKNYGRKTANFPSLAIIEVMLWYTDRKSSNCIISGSDWNIIGVPICQAISETEAKTRQLTEAK